MPHEVEIVETTFKDAKWSVTEATPGDKVTLEVAAEDIGAGAKVFFEVLDPDGAIDWKEGAQEGKAYKLKDWRVPNTLADVDLEFLAILVEEPKTTNGHQAVRKRLISSNKLKVHGYTPVIAATTDKAFVPVDEQLHVNYKVTYAGNKTLKARFEIWGEKYTTNKPIHTVDIDVTGPNVNADATWNAWDGKVPNGAPGPLDDKPLSPEFTPYRVRLVVGPDTDSLDHQDDPAKGKGIVAVSEIPFEVTFQNVIIRVEENIVESTIHPRYELKNVLAVEKIPASRDGTFKAMGRLPLEGENGRIRISMERHWNTGENFDQGTGANGPADLRITSNYAASKKYDSDALLYNRPEIPIELAARLKSRDAVAYPDGRFKAAAVGELHMEPYMRDVYRAGLYAGNARNTYFKNADHKIKRGTHNAPTNAAPVFDYWQVRFKIADANVRQYDVAGFDNTLSYNTGANELTVWLNRAKLVLNTDYTEVNGTTIELAAGLHKVDDILWIVRVDPGAPVAVPTWKKYPPGTNCAAHYGGIRGAAANNLFLDDFSGAADVGPVNGGFTYVGPGLVDLAPDAAVLAANQERVRVKTINLVGNAKLGLSGILFSPSIVAGDTYELHARIDHTAYERTLGAIGAKPWVDSKTGPMTVWRWMTIHRSVRMPNANTVGLGGRGSVADDALEARVHPADGRNMNVSEINRFYADAFNEWTIATPVPVTAATAATPIAITAPNHGLSTGDTVMISGVLGNTNANGSYVVTRTGASTFTLHTAYDFTTIDGVGAARASSGNYVPPTVAAATNAAPIEITTAANHNIPNGTYVTISGVTGLTVANGFHKVTVTALNRFTLDGSDGRDSPAYANGGTVYTGHLDVHRGVNLFAYKTRYAAVMNMLGHNAGAVPMATAADLQMEFSPWDHYRESLPPGVAPNKFEQGAATKVINTLAAGTSSLAAMNAVSQVVNLGGKIGSFFSFAPVVNIPVSVLSVNQYSQWVKNQAGLIQQHILNTLAPGLVPPRTMPVLRWPRLYHHGVWTNGAIGFFAATFDTNNTYTQGWCAQGGKSLFESDALAPGLFEHEMGHSIHLSHFVVGNNDFNWKQHDLAFQECVMSYTFTRGYILKPVGGTAPNLGAVDEAWPIDLPNPIPPNSSYDSTTGVPGTTRAIGFGIVPAKDLPCAKCILKSRGWDDEALPCAWRHSDLY